MTPQRIRPDPHLKQHHWYTAARDGARYSTVCATAGIGALRHDICIVNGAADEPVSSAWDAMGNQAKLREIVADLDPARTNPQLHAIAGSAEATVFRWGIYKAGLRPSWVSA